MNQKLSVLHRALRHYFGDNHQQFSPSVTTGKLGFYFKTEGEINYKCGDATSCCQWRVESVVLETVLGLVLVAGSVRSR